MREIPGLVHESVLNLKETKPEKKRSIEETDIHQKLKDKEIELLSREPLSGGIMGPIYLLNCKDQFTNETIKLVEKAYTNCGQKEKRFMKQDDESPYNQYRKRFEIIDGPTGKKESVFDWGFNERKALEVMQGIKGIPKFYGAIDKAGQSSILMEYIDGQDLSMLENDNLSEEEINKIFDNIKETFTMAAKKGIIHLNMNSATIMLDNNSNPFITDWHLHTNGDLNTDTEARNSYEKGLRDIESRRKDTLEILITAEN